MNMPILLAALAMLESGDARHPNGNDNAVGEHGEVSRFQIMRGVWNNCVEQSGIKVTDWPPTSEGHASLIAQRILQQGNQRFRKHRLRDPFPDEMYACWHRPAAFRKCGYRLDKMPARVQERCQRFASLVKELEKTQ